MKFVVTHGPLNEIDVQLTYKSKEKIRKIIYAGFWIACTSLISFGLTRRSSSKS